MGGGVVVLDVWPVSRLLFTSMKNLLVLISQFKGMRHPYRLVSRWSYAHYKEQKCGQATKIVDIANLGREASCENVWKPSNSYMAKEI